MDLPDTQGDALQFFNDGESFGCFGEMEHRSPSGARDPRKDRSTNFYALYMLLDFFM